MSGEDSAKEGGEEGRGDQAYFSQDIGHICEHPETAGEQANEPREKSVNQGAVEKEGGDTGGSDGVTCQFGLPDVEGGLSDEAVELADGVGQVQDTVF